MLSNLQLKNYLGVVIWFLASTLAMYLLYQAAYLIEGIDKVSFADKPESFLLLFFHLQRQSRKIQPYLVISCFSLAFTGFFVFLLPPMVFVLLAQIYIVIILSSIYYTFKEEEEAKRSSQSSSTCSASVPTIAVVAPEPPVAQNSRNVAFVPESMVNPYAFSSAPPSYEKV